MKSQCPCQVEKNYVSVTIWFMFALTVRTWTGYPPANYCNMSPPKGTFEDDVPFPMVRYVGSCRIFPWDLFVSTRWSDLNVCSRPKRTSSSNCPLDLKTSRGHWKILGQQSNNPGKLTWTPQKWRFGSNDFSSSIGWFTLPETNMT